MSESRTESAYSKKLRDPRWQRRRLEIMQRDDFACQSCGDKASTLHVHHRWYEAGAEPWDYGDLALVTLCEACHQQEGERMPEAARELVMFLKAGGAMATQFEVLNAVIGPALTAKPLDWREWLVFTLTIAEALRERESGAGNWHERMQKLLKDTGGVAT